MGFGVAEVAGWVRLTSSGVVGDSGKAIDVIGYTIKSGGTAGVLSIINGTVQTAPLAWADTATTVSQENSKTLAYPVRLAAGCYISFDANVSAATIFYRQMLS
jgi:hypothetical protein